MRHAASLIALTALVASVAASPFATAAETPPAKPAAKPLKNRAPATPREQLQSEAKGLAVATTAVEEATQNQLDIAARVLTGRADCEFNQSVQVDAVPEHPGYFRVAFGKASYLMAPEETTTGAVRLVDKNAQVVWLQIPVKSMLMNAKVGQRMVDACQHAEQRAAVEAVKGATTQPTSTLQ